VGLKKLLVCVLHLNLPHPIVLSLLLNVELILHFILLKVDGLLVCFGVLKRDVCVKLGLLFFSELSQVN